MRSEIARVGCKVPQRGSRRLELSRGNLYAVELQGLTRPSNLPFSPARPPARLIDRLRLSQCPPRALSLSRTRSRPSFGSNSARWAPPRGGCELGPRLRPRLITPASFLERAFFVLPPLSSVDIRHFEPASSKAKSRHARAKAGRGDPKRGGPLSHISSLIRRPLPSCPRSSGALLLLLLRLRWRRRRMCRQHGTR